MLRKMPCTPLVLRVLRHPFVQRHLLLRRPSSLRAAPIPETTAPCRSASAARKPQPPPRDVDVLALDPVEDRGGSARGSRTGATLAAGALGDATDLDTMAPSLTLKPSTSVVDARPPPCRGARRPAPGSPWCCSRAAVNRPPAPAPMTTTSYFSLMCASFGSAGVSRSAAGRARSAAGPDEVEDHLAADRSGAHETGDEPQLGESVLVGEAVAAVGLDRLVRAFSAASAPTYFAMLAASPAPGWPAS